MRKLLQILIITFALLLFSSPVFAEQFKVIWIYDGDTFKAKGHDIEIVVRFIAIDAPEISYRKGEASQPFSEQAKKMLTELILNRIVKIKGYGLDKYNRLLAVVSYAGKNIGVEMIRQGLAEIYQGELPDNFDLKDYNRAEFQAKTSRRGMWSQGDNYISPREWRERELRRENAY
jgi:endonuclease YncB( thermonuclease family)